MDLIKRIVSITKQIYNLYLELYHLEISGCKDSLVYSMTIAQLRKLFVLEKRLYDSAKNNENVYYSLLDYAESVDKTLYLRIYNYLESDQYLGYDGDLIVADQSDHVNYRLYTAFFSDVSLMQMSFIQEYIDSPDFSYLQSRLLFEKYYQSLLYHNVGAYLLNSSFSVGRELYVGFDYVADMFHLSITDRDTYLVDGCLGEIAKDLSSLSSISDNFCMGIRSTLGSSDDLEAVVLFITLVTHLRSLFCLMDDYLYQEVVSNVSEMIAMLSNDNNTISMGVAKEILASRDKDKVRVRRIHG